jgi:hypothetical protein
MNYSLTSLYGALEKKPKTIENYHKCGCDSGTSTDTQDVEYTDEELAMFRNVLLIAMLIWFAALSFLFSNWESMPVWARLVASLAAMPNIPGGPLVIILTVLITRVETVGIKQQF